MATATTITGARTIWELVDRRCRGLAGPPHVHRCRRPDADLRRISRPGPGGGRRAGGRGVHEGTGRLLAAPHPDRHGGPVDGPEPAGRGAEPDHPPLPRAEVGFALRQTGARRSSSSPASGGAPTTSALAHRALDGSPARRPEIVVVDDGLPEGDPATLPPPPAGRRRRRPGPLDLLHLGQHGRPQGRPPHRPDPHRRRLGPGRGPRHVARRRRVDRLPLRPHRRSRLPGDHADAWDSRRSWSRPSWRPTCSRSSAGTAPPWSAAAPPSTSPSWPSSASSPASPILPDPPAHVRRWRPQAPRGPLRGARRDRRARRRPRLRHDRGAR